MQGQPSHKGLAARRGSHSNEGAVSCANASPHIHSVGSNVPVLPKEFLGRSAPRLREITLSGIPYPALPALLRSASHLVTLELHRIPPTGYISPQAMATCLAALPRLDTLDLQLQSVFPRPERIRPPVTRFLLPALTSFEFRGASEYLEDLVARIESPTGPDLDCLLEPAD